jgi:hypothetical protein
MHFSTLNPPKPMHFSILSDRENPKKEIEI